MNEVVKAIIVDDSQNSLDLLKSYLTELFPNRIEVVGQAKNIDEAILLFSQKAPSLLFLDIVFSDKETGFNLLEKIKSISKIDCNIIFVTGHSDFAIKAIKHGAFDYLLKPLDIEDLKSSIDRYFSSINSDKLDKERNTPITNLGKPAKKIVLKTKDNAYYVLLESIIRCESSHNYTKFFLTESKDIVISKTLKKVEELLPSDTFVRVHRSHIVNVNFVEKIYKKERYILLNNGKQVPFSRRKKTSALKIIQK